MANTSLQMKLGSSGSATTPMKTMKPPSRTRLSVLGLENGSISLAHFTSVVIFPITLIKRKKEIPPVFHPSNNFFQFVRLPVSERISNILSATFSSNLIGDNHPDTPHRA